MPCHVVRSTVTFFALQGALQCPVVIRRGHGAVRNVKDAQASRRGPCRQGSGLDASPPWTQPPIHATLTRPRLTSSREIDSDDCTIGPHGAIAGTTQLLTQRQVSVHVGDAGDVDQRNDVPLPAITPMQSAIGLLRLDAGQNRPRPATLFASRRTRPRWSHAMSSTSGHAARRLVFGPILVRKTAEPAWMSNQIGVSTAVPSRW
jgi:hypothetical protein